MQQTSNYNTEASVSKQKQREFYRSHSNINNGLNNNSLHFTTELHPFLIPCFLLQVLSQIYFAYVNIIITIHITPVYNNDFCMFSYTNKNYF